MTLCAGGAADVARGAGRTRGGAGAGRRGAGPVLPGRERAGAGPAGPGMATGRFRFRRGGWLRTTTRRSTSPSVSRDASARAGIGRARARTGIGRMISPRGLGSGVVRIGWTDGARGGRGRRSARHGRRFVIRTRGQRGWGGDFVRRVGAQLGVVSRGERRTPFRAPPPFPCRRHGTDEVAARQRLRVRAGGPPEPRGRVLDPRVRMKRRSRPEGRTTRARCRQRRAARKEWPRSRGARRRSPGGRGSPAEPAEVVAAHAPVTSRPQRLRGSSTTPARRVVPAAVGGGRPPSCGGPGQPHGVQPAAVE